MGQSMNDELERMWKEAVVNKLEVKSPYLSGEKEEDTKNLRIVTIVTEIRT
jgi:hypothetical protein